MSDYTIRPMTRRDLEVAIAWAAAEGWNPGLEDADCFYAADPTGFWMGCLDGVTIAAISVVKYDPQFAFLGFYLVKPEFRGRGYGYRLWQAGLASCPGRVVGLDGVVAQQANYLKSGFTLAHRNIRYEGWGRPAAGECPPPVTLTPLDPTGLAAIVAYDRAFFPGDRAPFMQCWLTRPGGVGVVAWHPDQVAGYGWLRPCQTGYKIGPLFADQPAVAEAILAALSQQVPPDQPFYLDVPAINLAAVALAQKYAMTPQFETARMYAHGLPPLPTERIFGITTFELG
ncbi:MAG TPA: GNAT family N-acetyltransferase [Candidatus Obscuribacterales bacterium]